MRDPVYVNEALRWTASQVSQVEGDEPAHHAQILCNRLLEKTIAQAVEKITPYIN